MSLINLIGLFYYRFEIETMNNSLEASESDLKKQLDNSDFATAVFNQLSKEFDKIGIDLAFNDDELQDYVHFKNRLSEEILAIIRGAPNRLNQLFYLSDLPEQQVNELFKTAAHPQQEIAELLLHRITQKVILRKKHKMGLL